MTCSSPATCFNMATVFEDEREYLTRNTGVRILAHTLDLGQPPAGLLADVRSLAESMRTLTLTDIR